MGAEGVWGEPWKELESPTKMSCPPSLTAAAAVKEKGGLREKHLGAYKTKVSAEGKWGKHASFSSSFCLLKKKGRERQRGLAQQAILYTLLQFQPLATKCHF